jgi:23S rRNA (adenine2503-C2)-methyltransferase
VINSVQGGCLKLCLYKKPFHKIIKLHWAFIEGENDSEFDVGEIAQAVSNIGLRVDINIVRYNPYSPVQGKEPAIELIEDRVNYLKFLLPESEVKIIGRVGRDVYASCGTFVPK